MIRWYVMGVEAERERMGVVGALPPLMLDWSTGGGWMELRTRRLEAVRGEGEVWGGVECCLRGEAVSGEAGGVVAMAMGTDLGGDAEEL
jgi:hypothetical protein